MILHNPVNIKIIDSRNDSKATYLFVDACKVQIMKAKLNDLCYILRLINDECHLELDTKGCEVINGK